jgi:RNA polymerase sigma-70 factor (ECF subfamily)
MMLPQNHDALESCAREYGSRFLSTARRLLRDETVAQDAVQDAMLSAARNLDRFRGDSQLPTWLERIVINSALTRRRVMRRRSEQPLEGLLEHRDPHRRQWPPLAADGPCPERRLWRRELRSLIRAAIDELPADLRIVMVLWHFQEAEVAEIASRLRISPNAVRIRLHRARRALHRLLAGRLAGSNVLAIPAKGARAGV